MGGKRTLSIFLFKKTQRVEEVKADPPNGTEDENIFSRDLVGGVARLDGTDGSTQLKPEERDERPQLSRP